MPPLNSFDSGGGRGMCTRTHAFETVKRFSVQYCTAQTVTVKNTLMNSVLLLT